MKKRDVINTHDREASQYDQQVRDYEYYVHDILFGMCYEFINENQYLLDIGIGTGLASLPFAKAGLQVYGFDGSTKMLKICDSKSFARELKKHDILNPPYPYGDNFFDYVISCSVFHFFGELTSIFNDVNRIIKPNGIFAFTIGAPDTIDIKTKDGSNPEYMEKPTSWGEPIIVHYDSYIMRLLKGHNFEMIKIQKILIPDGEKGRDDNILFKIYVARQSSN
ncbi:MAG: class I SAM-dependent methyltransferase [candidate division Zixibacteria bacterium]